MTGIKIHSDWKRGNGQDLISDEARVASAVIRGRGIPTVLITLAEKGADHEHTRTFYYKAIEDVEVVDPRAAGDAFIGAFCTRICTNDSTGKSADDS